MSPSIDHIVREFDESDRRSKERRAAAAKEGDSLSWRVGYGIFVFMVVVFVLLIIYSGLTVLIGG